MTQHSYGGRVRLETNPNLGTNPNVGAYPNLPTHGPPCQHFLWGETGVPGETPRLSVERVDRHFHTSVMCLQRESNPQSQR
jgi:hypothetical protein